MFCTFMKRNVPVTLSPVILPLNFPVSSTCSPNCFSCSSRFATICLAIGPLFVNRNFLCFRDVFQNVLILKKNLLVLNVLKKYGNILLFFLCVVFLYFVMITMSGPLWDFVPAMVLSIHICSSNKIITSLGTPEPCEFDFGCAINFIGAGRL